MNPCALAEKQGWLCHRSVRWRVLKYTQKSCITIMATGSITDLQQAADAEEEAMRRITIKRIAAVQPADGIAEGRSISVRPLR